MYEEIQMRVLVIDDQQDLLEIIKETLEDEGYIVQCATCIEQAQELLNSESYDLLLCDLVLPSSKSIAAPHSSTIGMLGIKRFSELFPKIPIVAMSGDICGDALHFTKTLGARGTLEKPFNVENLLDKIESTLIAWA
jgi:CheY-like chemotaxis protein